MQIKHAKQRERIQEYFGRHATRRGSQRLLGGADRPHPSAGQPPALGFGAPFRKLPPLPLRSHLGPWLSRFDPTARATPTGL